MARVVAIVQDAYAPNIARMGQPPAPTLDDCARRLAAAQLWGIKVQGCVKGALVLEDGTDALLIDDIAIDPTAQNTGLATAGLVFAETEASLRALLTLRLYNEMLRQRTSPSAFTAASPSRTARPSTVMTAST